MATAFKTNSTDEQLATAVVDDLLRRYRFQDEEQFDDLRQASASSQEIILTDLITAKTRQSATLI